MDTPDKNGQMERRENWTRENRRATFMFGNEVISEISSSCPALISPARKVGKKNVARRRLTSEVLNRGDRVNDLHHEARLENACPRRPAVLSKARPANDDCFELEILLHQMEHRYLRLRLELEENKRKLEEFKSRNELLRSQLEMISSENVFLKSSANQKPLNRPNFVTPRKVNETNTREEDNQETLRLHSEVKIEAKTETLSLVVPRRRGGASNVSTSGDFEETSRTLSPLCRWENNSSLKINRAFEESNVAELRKLLVASVVESEVLLSKLRDAENRRLETLNQAEKSQSDLNDEIAQLKSVKRRTEILEQSRFKEELTLARNELRTAKERVDRLENEFGTIKLKLEEGIENAKLDKERLECTKPEKRRESRKIKSVFDFVKDMFGASSVDGAQINVTALSDPAVESLTLGQDALNDTELESDPFDHRSKYQASTPKTDNLLARCHSSELLTSFNV